MTHYYKAYYIEEDNGNFYVDNNMFSSLQDAESYVDNQNDVSEFEV